MVMRMYGARQLTGGAGHEIRQVIAALSARAELPMVPETYIIPSPTLNAFAVGRPEHAAIGLTSGLLQRLSLRELAGVLAHEMSHIRNNDLWIMGLADTMSRMTQAMSFTGMVLMFLNVPTMLFGTLWVPWSVALLLYFAPTLGSLLQLALSRAREFDADLEGAALTGDPAGLASALEKLERYQGRFWEDMIFPGRKIPQPSLLRSHPLTDERVRRLMQLRTRPPNPLPLPEGRVDLPAELVHGGQAPRYRWPGLWY